MTESEWRTSVDPFAMYSVIAGKHSRRKSVLLAVAAMRVNRWSMARPGMEALADATELHADCQVSHGTVTSHFAVCATGDPDGADRWLRFWPPYEYPWLPLALPRGPSADTAAELSVCCDLARCVFGTPFPPRARRSIGSRLTGAALGAVRLIGGGPMYVPPDPPTPTLFVPPIDPAWRTSTVVAIAQGIYEDRAFDRLPVLADAIEDAGCTIVDLLTHCRGPGPHVKGCWVVDAVLGKN